MAKLLRRIDDLGRVVIPKEIRRKLKLNTNDFVQISASSEGKIIIAKYMYPCLSEDDLDDEEGEDD